MSSPVAERRLDGLEALIVGLGPTGIAAGRLLESLGSSATIVSGWHERDAERAAAHVGGPRVVHGPFDQAQLDGVDLVIAGPNVPERTPPIRWARQRGVAVWSELELAARVCDVPYVAITGTNGKSTTTALVATAMRHAGLDAVACGDQRLPFSSAVGEAHDALAVEVASSQLHYTRSLHPSVSVLLNLAPDHIDWHGSFHAYAGAKARVFLRQTMRDVHVGNRDDSAAAAISHRAPARLCWFGARAPKAGEVGIEGDVVVSRLDGARSDLGRPSALGPGGLMDAAAAATASLSFGLPEDAVARAVCEMDALPHRGATVGMVGGVRFIDDSKATNPHATLTAVSEIGRCVLIAGGDSKGVDMTPLAIAADRLDGVVVFGSAASEIADAFVGLTPVHRATSMDEAVRQGFRAVPGGGSVLLAPACASGDMFLDYADRGEAFAAAVGRLARGERVPTTHPIDP
jgi:UDP-N-acetylmuramoylalanine--D-glutamate ligase